MFTFLGLLAYEYRMTIRRWGMWVAYAIGGFLFARGWIGMVQGGQLAVVNGPRLTFGQWAGTLGIGCNGMMAVVTGIIVADRLVRDREIGVRELLRATPLSRRTYILGKYAGVMLAALTPALLTVLGIGGAFVVRGLPLAFMGSMLLAFLAINLPAHLFVGAFSLACPEVLPVRVYQVLFTGYWFWGNFIPSEMMPTINGTLLTAKGDLAASAFFHEPGIMAQRTGTPLEAALNIAVLGACAAGALFAVERYLAWQERRA